MDSRRVRYMMKYGELKDNVLLQMGRPELLRSTSEPWGRTHLPVDSPDGFQSTLLYQPVAPGISRPPQTSSSFTDEHLLTDHPQDTDVAQSLLTTHSEAKPTAQLAVREADRLPIITCVVICIHLVVFVVACALYGFSPIGLGVRSRFLGIVLLPNQSRHQVCWADLENPLLGPRQADLIQMGARYPPCMRFDRRLHSDVVEARRASERLSGCCIHREMGHCYQTQRFTCPAETSDWLNRANGSLVAARMRLSPLRRLRSTDASSSHPIESLENVTGPVCGLDPDYCMRPPPDITLPWSNDITEWPVCEHSINVTEVGSLVRHMQCRVTAKPCCFGIRGECMLTSREHCDFMRATYHPEASLCSQVNCMKDVCGLGLFMNKNYPDQVYRLVTSLFVHQGLISLGIMLVIHWKFMANFERFEGFCTIGTLYLFCGCFGNLLAAVFLPYQVGTGSSASLMGLAGFRAVSFFFYSGPRQKLSSDIVAFPLRSVKFSRKRGMEEQKMSYADVVSAHLCHLANVCRISPRMRVGVCKNVLLIFCIFLIGHLPWIDNFANLGGFLSGVLLAFVVLPYRAFCLAYSSSEGSPSIPSKQSVSHLPRVDSMSTRMRRRVPVEVMCSFLWLFLFSLLLCVLTLGPVLPACNSFRYFTCIPLAPNLCDSFCLDTRNSSECRITT